jgi:hypothetical protein
MHRVGVRVSSDLCCPSSVRGTGTLVDPTDATHIPLLAACRKLPWPRQYLRPPTGSGWNAGDCLISFRRLQHGA